MEIYLRCSYSQGLSWGILIVLQGPFLLYHWDLEKREDLRNSLILLGVTSLCGWLSLSCATTPHHTLIQIYQSTINPIIVENFDAVYDHTSNNSTISRDFESNWAIRFPDKNNDEEKNLGTRSCPTGKNEDGIIINDEEIIIEENCYTTTDTFTTSGKLTYIWFFRTKNLS